MIRVSVSTVFLSSKGDEFVVLLKGTDDPRTLPISIGQLEAQAIALQLHQVRLPRPLTHDLFKNTLELVGYRVAKVIISEIIDNTFYARLFFEKEGELTDIDSRPSDALALALRFDAPVFVEEKVMDESGILTDGDAPAPETGDPPGPEARSPLDTLKADLARAVLEERYEDASRLRDEIGRLSKAN